MTRNAMLALRQERQFLGDRRADEADYLALYRDMQPGQNVYWNGFGQPPTLSFRAAFDDLEYNRQRQRKRTLVKGRFGGGNLGWGNNRSCAAGLIGAENLQMITSTFDRIADLKNAVTLSQADTANRFGQLDTHLCDAIANTINQVRNQGDRVNDQLNDVSRQIASCCCDLKSILAGISCEIRGVGRDVNDARLALDQRIALSEERLGSKIELGNERLACLIKDQAKDAEIARQNREIWQLQNALNQSTMWNKMNKVAARAVEDLEEFSMNHYTPTRTTTAAAGA